MGRYTFFWVVLFCSGLILTGCGADRKSYKEGMELAAGGDYQKAAKCMEKAIQDNKERAEYYIGYGMILNKQGEYQKAVEQFEHARQEVQNSIANANNKQVFYGEAISYYYLGDYEKSLEYCDKALELAEPESLDVNILCSKGTVLETTGETETALKVYGQAIEKDSQNWSAYLKRASLEERLGQEDKAKEDYQKVIQSDGKEKYEACFRLYDLCQTLGEDDTPEQALHEIISSKSEDAFVICQMGWAYHYQGEEDKAEEYLEQSLEKGYEEAEYYLGMLAMEKQDYTSAQKYFEHYLSSGQGGFQAMACNQLAGCAIESGNLDTAQQYLEDGLAMADGSGRACLWKNQVILWEKQGDYAQAKKVAKAYLSVYPQDKAMQKELRFIKTRKQRKVKKQDASQDGAQDSSQEGTGNSEQNGAGEEAGNSGQGETREGAGSSGQNEAEDGAESSGQNGTGTESDKTGDSSEQEDFVPRRSNQEMIN